MPSTSGYAGMALGPVAAFGLSGAPIFNSLDGIDLDAVQHDAGGFDVCMSHAMSLGAYHYHTWSPCLRKGKGLWNNKVVPANCKGTTGCFTNKTSFGNTYPLASGYSNADDKQNLEIIALARDGHVLYGPWDENGNLHNCDSHDACNGRFFDDGSYAYVATTTFPYTVGCWGPAVA